MQLQSIEIARRICARYVPKINFWDCKWGTWNEVNGVFLFQGELDRGYEYLSVKWYDTFLDYFITKIHDSLNVEHGEFSMLDMELVIDILFNYYNELYGDEIGHAHYVMDKEGFFIQIDGNPIKCLYIRFCDFNSGIEMRELDEPFTDFIDYMLRFRRAKYEF